MKWGLLQKKDICMANIQAVWKENRENLGKLEGINLNGNIAVNKIKDRNII
jgi:hypothetical protein